MVKVNSLFLDMKEFDSLGICFANEDMFFTLMMRKDSEKKTSIIVEKKFKSRFICNCLREEKYSG